MKSSDFNILLIDDDEDDFFTLRDVLGDIPSGRYMLQWKSNFKDGLAALQAEKFDACLLDYRLGAETGLDLLMEAKKFEIECPFVFLTGQSDFDLDIQAMRLGAADYLVKDQLTAPLLERSIRYSIKHSMDLKEIRDREARILQQDRLASLGLLASSLAHEIGTPLGIIRSRAELMNKKMPESESVKKDLSIVILQIDRISKLVNSLLHIARGKTSEHTGPVLLTDVIQDVLNLVDHELKRKGIQLTATGLEGVVVKAEAGPLGQVFLNLLVNAVHAIEEEIVKGNLRQHLVTIKAVDHGGSIEITVQDTGCGIPEKNVNSLFKPFFTTKEIGSGSGLGLATSYKIVESWGGKLKYQKPNDSGASFIINLLKV